MSITSTVIELWAYGIQGSGHYEISIDSSNLNGVHPIDFLGIHFNNHNNHNRVRVYYLFRNALIVMKLYPSTIPEWLLLYIKIWIKTICVENDKIGKLKYSLYGLYDGMTKKMGKIQHN